MKVEKIEPKVIQYKLMPSNEEECKMGMWAIYVFDCYKGELSIHSSVGNYFYGWGRTKHGDFMHLMSMIESDYLLNKIANRTVFDIETNNRGPEVVCDLFFKYIQPQIKKDFAIDG